MNKDNERGNSNFLRMFKEKPAKETGDIKSWENEEMCSVVVIKGVSEAAEKAMLNAIESFRKIILKRVVFENEEIGIHTESKLHYKHDIIFPTKKKTKNKNKKNTKLLSHFPHPGRHGIIPHHQ